MTLSLNEFRTTNKRRFPSIRGMLAPKPHQEAPPAHVCNYVWKRMTGADITVHQCTICGDIDDTREGPPTRD